MSFLIHSFPSGPIRTNAYIVADPIKGEAVVIDPAPESFLHIQSFIEQRNLKLTKILLTHSHWDHIADVKKIKDAYPIPVYIHSLDTPNLQHPGIDQIPCPLEIAPVMPDYFLKEGMEIAVGALLLQVIHTPGHSPGSVCFYEAQKHFLISGDTLFRGAIGNVSFPTSQPELMHASLNKLAQLPRHTAVFPGHGRETTLGEEF